MKKTITLGSHTVEVEILRAPTGAVAFTAKCGEVVKRGMLNPTQGKHDQTEEQFIKDIDEFSTRLATEAAGHAQALLLSSRVLGDSNEKNPASGGAIPSRG